MFLADVLFPQFPDSTSIPADLANSLTSSLLNQPLPVRVNHHPGHPPAMGVKSRKETRCHSQAEPSPSVLSSTSTRGYGAHDIRNISQQMRVPTGASIPVGGILSQVHNPNLKGPRRGFEPDQRANSMDETRTDETRESTPERSLRIISGNYDKGTKRTPNFTPASAKVVDKEDEPRRASPRLRLSPFSKSDELASAE